MVVNSKVLFMDRPSIDEEIMDCEVFLSWSRENNLTTDVERVEGVLAYLKSKRKAK